MEVVTDNLNRSSAEVRHLFSKYGGQMGANGNVSWMFERKGVIEIDAKGKDEDELMMMALEAGAADVEIEEESAVIYTEPGDLSTVRTALEEAGCTFLSVERELIAKNTVEVTDPEAVEKVRRIIDILDDYDDTQNVWHNAILPEEEEEDD